MGGGGGLCSLGLPCSSGPRVRGQVAGGRAVSPLRRGGRARAGGLRLKGVPGERFGLWPRLTVEGWSQRPDARAPEGRW